MTMQLNNAIIGGPGAPVKAVFPHFKLCATPSVNIVNAGATYVLAEGATGNAILIAGRNYLTGNFVTTGAAGLTLQIMSLTQSGAAALLYTALNIPFGSTWLAKVYVPGWACRLDFINNDGAVATNLTGWAMFSAE